MPQNHFTVDDDPSLNLSPAQKRTLLDQLLKEASTTSTVIDISRPVHIPYNPRDPKNEFPKVLYSPEGKPVKVHSKAEEEKLVKREKYLLTPPAKHAAAVDTE